MSAPQIYQIQELSEEQKNFIKASIPVLELLGEVLTSAFYAKMLAENKEVRPFFNETNQKLSKQPKILAYALLNYAKNIDDISPLVAFVNQIVVKHTGLQVKAEHYPIVGNTLLATMKELLGPETASEEFLDAWAVAYGNLAQILINAEHSVYVGQKWNGFRDFEVTKMADECDDVKSVYFRPVDGKPVSIPKRGQYVCIRWNIPEKEETSREYSLSQFPRDNEYRISVRKLPGGSVSGFVHSQLKIGDVLKVAPPVGNFVYEESTKDALFFIGGIGITPVLPVMEKCLVNGQKVTLLYSNSDIEHRPFGNFLRSLKQHYDTFKVVEFLSEETQRSLKCIDQAKSRRLQPSDFDALDLENSDIYMLGPVEYMKFVKAEIAKRLSAEIRGEFFGPTSV